jgi:hypothetical protein
MLGKQGLVLFDQGIDFGICGLRSPRPEVLIASLNENVVRISFKQRTEDRLALGIALLRRHRGIIWKLEPLELLPDSGRGFTGVSGHLCPRHSPAKKQQ